MLNEMLKNGNVFKLVCGAGNENPESVERLVALYAMAGAHYFDLSAKPEIVEAAYRGLKKVIPIEFQKDYFFNVSVGIKGDPHVSKACVDEKKCIGCGKCETNCLQEAVKINDFKAFVNRKDCIGCGRCESECPVSAVSMLSEDKDMKSILLPLINKGIHSIEFHAVTDDLQGVISKWNEIEEIFDGTLSLCTDRSHLGNQQLIALINALLEKREPYTTIIQADGCPMSGGEDDYATTLQAVAIAQIVERENLPVFLLLSGGTNSKTVELAKMCNIHADGVSLGSYARTIVKRYISRDDFHEPEIFNEALLVAKQLVETCDME